MPTPYPTEHLPTVIALTIEALDLYITGSAPAPTSTPGTAEEAARAPTQVPASPGTSEVTPPSETATSTNETGGNPTSGTPTRTQRPPTPTPTPTTTPGIPFAEIQILSPGPVSRVVSPIQVSAFLMPGARGIVRVELVGEDGRLLVRKLLTYYPGIRVRMNIELEFEIPAVAETGRVQILTEDRYGRTIALASVEVILLSMGVEDLNPAGDLLEAILIREPVTNSLIQGGQVRVSGLVRTQSENPLQVEMFSVDGKQIGPTRLVTALPTTDGRHTPFEAELPYDVSTPTWVRLMVKEFGSRIPGPTQITSVEILLSP